MAEMKRIALSLLLLALVALYSGETLADIGGVGHSRGVIFSATRRLGCTFCHPKIADENVWSVSTLGLVETYRCLACHAGVSRTVQHYREVASGPHASVGCIYCHQVHHDGHDRPRGGVYRTDFGARTYGCGCHNIASNLWDPLPGSHNAYSFLVTYFVSSTATRLADLAKNIFFYTSTLRDGRVTSVIAFTNPYTGAAGSYPATQRNLTCLHCHFTNIGPAAWGTTTSYIYRHPGECASCHSRLVTATGGFTSASSAKAHTVDISYRAYDVYCGRCHEIGRLVAQSVHARLGCRCHSVLHVSRYNSTASWITIMAAPAGTYHTFKDNDIDWNQWRIVLRYTPYNNSAYCIWFKPEAPEERYYPDFYGGVEPCVPVYAILQGDVVRYAGIAYTMRDGMILANTTAHEFFGSRWLICYNCHLINLPGGGSVGKGSIMISLDLLSLSSVNPHALNAPRSGSLPPRGLHHAGEESSMYLPIDESTVTVIAALTTYLALVLITLRSKTCTVGG